MEQSQRITQSFCLNASTKLELINLCISLQIMLTFSAVFGVIVYRITTAAALSFSTNGTTRSNVRVTVTATAVIINLVVILILDEIYGAVAKWLTEIGKTISTHCSVVHYVYWQESMQEGLNRNISHWRMAVKIFRPIGQDAQTCLCELGSKLQHAMCH